MTARLRSVGGGAPVDLSGLTGENLLTSDDAFGLEGASPLQRSIMRAAGGESIEGLLTEEECTRYFGCSVEEIGRVTPTLVAVVAGVRGGKSLMLAAACLRAALTADLSALRPHEIPRAAIVAPSVDNARATYNLLLGAIRSSPFLASLLVGEPREESFFLRRADGRTIEVVVCAAHRGGMTLRSRWLVFVGFDESALFGVEQTGAAVNAEELLRAGETRLVPGGQAWVVSSPFGPSGLLHSLWREHFGEPGRVLVCHAPTRSLNPAFPLEQIEAIRRRDPDACAREYDASWLDAVTTFLEGQQVDGAVRDAPLELPPQRGARHLGAWDAGTRSNSWSLVIGRVIPATSPAKPRPPRKRDEDDEEEDRRPRKPVRLPEPAAPTPARLTIVAARQWTGSRTEPLDPAKVVKEAGELLASYGVREILCDQWSVDSIRAVAKTHAPGLTVTERPPTAAQQGYATIRTLLGTGCLELAPEPTLISDLKALRRKALAGAVRIELPRTADGRHADYAPCVALVANEMTVGEPSFPITAVLSSSRYHSSGLSAQLERQAVTGRHGAWGGGRGF